MGLRLSCSCSLSSVVDVRDGNSHPFRPTTIALLGNGRCHVNDGNVELRGWQKLRKRRLAAATLLDSHPRHVA